MKVKTKLRYKLIIYSILVLFAMSIIVPLIYIISLSFTPDSVILSGGYKMFPREITFESYKTIFEAPTQLINSYKITILFSALTTFFSIILMSMCAYSLSRQQFLYKKFVTFFIYFTMLFSGGLIPSYIINTKYLGLGNNFWVYVLPALINPYYILVMRTFFKGIPSSLSEAAKIDGAGEFTILKVIILPLSKPVLATISLMTLLAKWNDWNTALIYIMDNELYSLQYMLQKILRETQFIQAMSETHGIVITEQLAKNTQVESLRFAMAILAAGPMMIIFPFFQKYFTRGLTIGAVKE